ncbi:hypothetical protein AgCh_020272 [Apium graveolens]
MITSSKNWMDSSDSEGENTCYALMASLDDPAASEPKNFSVDTHTVKIQITIMSEETQTSTKPTKTQETQNTQTHSRYETIRVPILRPSEYPIWKVKMAMFLEATDPEYLDRINEGPYKPTKLSVAVAEQPAKIIPKERGDTYLKISHLLPRMFVKLLNDLSLVDKEYDLKDSNIKFLLALPENWDLESTTIRDNYDLTETTLDKIYGMLKIYELEIDQRSKRHGRKSRTVVLKAEEESPKVVVLKKGKGKTLIIKSDSESSYFDDDDSETESLSKVDVDVEMMQLCALMVKGITPIAYKKFRKGKKFSRKGGSSDKKGFRKSEGKGGKSDRGDNSNVKCYNCGERGHISPDCKKGKSDKGKALVTKRKSWTDISDSEDEVNYALMVNVDSNTDTVELKVPQTTFAFNTDDITELRLYFKTMFISFRDQTLKCEILTSESLALKNRNDYLKEDEVLKLNESLKTDLEKEREIIRTWTNSGRTTQNLLSSGNWKECLDYGDDKSEKGTVQIEPTVVKQTAKPKVNPVKFVAKTVMSNSEKLKDSKTEVKEKTTSDKLKQDKPVEVNIGLMTKKQLKHKLKEIRNVNKGNRKNIIVLDSGCSGHMTGNKALLSDFVEKAGPGVFYEDGNMGKTLGYGNINLGNVIIESVALVSVLKHNLLSVSQICDRCYHMDFFEEHCEVVSNSTGKVVLKGYRHGPQMVLAEESNNNVET